MEQGIIKGDKVRFLGTPIIIYDNDGLDRYSDLKEGEIYTVEDSFIISVIIGDKMYMKEFFRKV